MTQLPRLWFACVLLLIGYCRPSWAGYWDLDRYEWSGTFQTQVIKWDHQYPTGVVGHRFMVNRTRTLRDKIIPVSQRAREEYSSDRICGGSSSDGCNTSTTIEYNSNRDRPELADGAPPSSVSFNYTIRAVFRWHGDREDLPRHGLFIREDATTYGYENVRQWDDNVIFSHTPASPYAGKRYTFANIDQSLSKERHAVVKGWSADPLSQETGRHAAYTEHAALITHIGNGNGIEISGPSRSFSGRIDLNASYSSQEDFDLVGSASLSPSYQADVARMSIAIRRKHAIVPKSTGPYNTSSVAAGGFDTPREEHWADVFVTFSPPPGRNPLPNQRIVMEEGGAAAYLKPGKWKANPSPLTNAQGEVRIGAFSTSDMRIPDATLTVQRHKDHLQEPIAKFRQAWDEDSGGYNGQPSHWEYDRAIDYGQEIPVAFRPSFRDTWSHGAWSNEPPIWEDVPITRHTMNFMVGKIKVTGIDTRTSSSSGSSAGPQTWIFTSNRREVNPQSVPPVLYASQALLDKYAFCTIRQATDGAEPGVYRTALVVPEPRLNWQGEPVLSFSGLSIRKASIDRVWLKAQDDTVYELIWGLFGNLTTTPPVNAGN